jgi:hypothetical protein
MLPTILGLLLAGCASDGGSAGQDVLQLSLQPTRENAGSLGQAVLAERGEQTDLSIFIGGVPMGLSRPLNLLTYIYPGSCSALADKPVYSLNQTVQTLRVDGGWRLSKSIPATLESLRDGGYALVLSSIPADRAMNIFCAEIK